MRNKHLKGQYQISRRVPFEQGQNTAGNRDLDQGIGLYQKFNHFSPLGVVKVQHSRIIPPVVVELGELVGLIYRSDKGQPGQPQAYIHFMQDLPRLVSSIEGTQLYIVGGSYRITKHGIEG